MILPIRTRVVGPARTPHPAWPIHVYQYRVGGVLMESRELPGVRYLSPVADLLLPLAEAVRAAARAGAPDTAYVYARALGRAGLTVLRTRE